MRHRFWRWWCAPFHQEGAIAYTACGSIDCLRVNFSVHFSSCFGDITWSAGSLDLFAPNNFSLRMRESQRECKKHHMLGQLKEHIRHDIQANDKCLLWTFIVNFQSLIIGMYCMQGRPLTRCSFFKKKLAFHYWFSIIFVSLTFNLIRQHSDLKIISFYSPILHNVHNNDHLQLKYSVNFNVLAHIFSRFI